MGDGNRQGMGTGNKFLRQYQGVRILTRTHVQLRSVQLSPPCLWLRRLFERYVSGALYSLVPRRFLAHFEHRGCARETPRSTTSHAHATVEPGDEAELCS